MGMSGGVDSSVTAVLMKEQGFDVVGVYMRNWSDKDTEVSGCTYEQDVVDARKVATDLGIPFYVWNFEKEYKQKVVDYMIRAYEQGITPNPDVMCNREIKFGIFLEKALLAGADFIATGHYVRKTDGARLVKNIPLHPLHMIREWRDLLSNIMIRHGKEEIFRLLKGKDPNKDQSYFLHQITQEQLKRVLFPIGEYHKSEVRKMAKERNLHIWDKKDSQGICFIGKVNIADFLKKRIPEMPGDMVLDDEIVGKHRGLSFYTIGQREGIQVAGPVPYYVASKNAEKNQLILAKGNMDERLYGKELHAIDAHWICGKEPVFPLVCQATIRYRQQPEQCVVEKQASGCLRVIFKNKQRAITPGQSIVFYQDEECLGGAGIVVV